MKITRFQDAPQMTHPGHYEIDFTPDRLLKWVGEEPGLDTNPDFQRAHCWTKKQQTAYIEFFLSGGRTARVLYFNKPSWHRPAKTSYDDFVLVDGRQRLEAWAQFLAGNIRVFGSRYEEYTDSLRLNQTMKVNINDLQTKAEVLQWYLDMNSMGVVHTDDELDRVRQLLSQEKHSGRN